MKVSLKTLVALGLVSAGSAMAQSLYEQTFENTTKNDRPLSSVGWEGFAGEGAHDVSASQAIIQSGVGTGVEPGRVYTSFLRAVPLALFTTGLRLDLQNGAEISFDAIQSATVGRVQLMVQVDNGPWFVSNTMWTPPKATNFVDVGETEYHQIYTFSRNATDWSSIKLDGGSAMEVGASLNEELPAGKITGLGFYLTNVHDKYGVVIRLDTLRVKASPTSAQSGTTTARLLAGSF